MNSLIHPTYFPNIANLLAMLETNTIVFEKYDNFQKQTLRNRMYIYGANGKLKLNIPIRHNSKSKTYYKDIKIAYDMDWRIVHKRSIESAYGTSPFYEFYQDELLPIFELKETFLYDLNLKTTEILFNCLQLPFNYHLNSKFEKVPKDYKDKRYLVDAKRNNDIKLQDYFQVFDTKHGFIPNLSGIDLICNLGPESSIYLNNQNLH